VDFKRLFHGGGESDFALNRNGGTRQNMSDLGIVADRRIINDLNRFKAGPIVELDEPDRSVIAIGTNPTFEINGIGLRDIFFAREVGIERLDSNGFWLHATSIKAKREKE
jgi:hypothetical protein